MRYKLNTNSFQKYMAVTIATNVSESTVAAVMENQSQLQGIDVIEDSDVYKRQAQVCSGGVATDEINPSTLESRLHRGLYFAGELLDIDGACGGYNLQWAWSSGAVAGIHGAKELI